MAEAAKYPGKQSQVTILGEQGALKDKSNYSARLKSYIFWMHFVSSPYVYVLNKYY